MGVVILCHPCLDDGDMDDDDDDDCGSPSFLDNGLTMHCRNGSI